MAFVHREDIWFVFSIKNNATRRNSWLVNITGTTVDQDIPRHNVSLG